MTFKCSYKILPLSLKKIGEIFNIGVKTVFPYTFVNYQNLYYSGALPDAKYFNSLEEYEEFSKYREKFNLKEDSIKYCKNDVKLTILFLKELNFILKEFKIPLISSFSAPSLSLKIFIKKFNKNKIITSPNHLLEKFARKSYYGGRCEVYGNPYENDKIFHFDFSGMYAQCMRENFPIGKYKLNMNLKDITLAGIYWIQYQSSEMEFPILPHHRKSDGKLMFTNGINEGAFWFEEILLFIENGGIIIKILYSLTYEKEDAVFKDFVDFFIELRKKSESYNIFGKLMINSMYGRLGMREREVHSFIENKENFDKISKKIDILNFRELNNIVLIEAKINDKLRKERNDIVGKEKNNIVIAAAITSKARIKLFKAQQNVIKNGGRLLYSDTDSIFAAFKRDVTNERHGEVFWDGEKSDTIIKEAIFFAPKSYALKYNDEKYKIKIKGYNQFDITFDEIAKKYREKSQINLKNYRYLNKRDMELIYHETLKNFDLNSYDKRYFINEYRTIPYIFKDEEYLI